MKHVLALITCLYASTAAAGSCLPRDEMHTVLTEDLEEQRVGLGYIPPTDAQPNGYVMSIYMNPVTGEWTVLLTNANNISCIAQYGTSMELDMPKVGEAL